MAGAGAVRRGWLRLVLAAAGDGSGGAAVACAELQAGKSTTWETTRLTSKQSINLLSSLLHLLHSESASFHLLEFPALGQHPRMFTYDCDSKELHILGHWQKIAEVKNLRLNLSHDEY